MAIRTRTTRTRSASRNMIEIGFQMLIAKMLQANTMRRNIKSVSAYCGLIYSGMGCIVTSQINSESKLKVVIQRFSWKDFIFR